MTLARLLGGAHLDQVRRDLQAGDEPSLARRRAVALFSLVGLASMATVSLVQMGLVRRLPDPPLLGFDSARVNSSDVAYALGLPDGTLAVADFALNLPLAALGGATRAKDRPWIPVAAAAKAAISAAVSAWYFYQMPAREKAWCGFCIVGAVASAVVFLLTIPEAREAVLTPQHRRRRPVRG